MLKPDPAIYYLALDRFRLRPAEALFVDDRAINVEAALAVGMRAHLFTDADDLRRGSRPRACSSAAPIDGRNSWNLLPGGALWR